MLQVDGYAGFKRLAGERADKSLLLAFCWAHTRRAFFEFHASTKSPIAAELLARVAVLYAIEAYIRGHHAEHRQRVRGERSWTIVEGLHGWLGEQLPCVSGPFDLAKAMRYALRHWAGLIAFLKDGRIERTRTWSSARSARSPLPARMRCSADRTAAHAIGRSR